MHVRNVRKSLMRVCEYMSITCSICPHLTTFLPTCSILWQFFFHPRHSPTSTMVSQKDSGGTVIYNVLSLNPRNVDHRWQLRSRTTFSILSHTSGLELTHIHHIFNTLIFLLSTHPSPGCSYLLASILSHWCIQRTYFYTLFPGLHGPLWNVDAIIVRGKNSIFEQNCALDETSMKLGIVVDHNPDVENSMRTHLKTVPVPPQWWRHHKTGNKIISPKI